MAAGIAALKETFRDQPVSVAMTPGTQGPATWTRVHLDHAGLLIIQPEKFQVEFAQPVDSWDHIIIGDIFDMCLYWLIIPVFPRIDL